MIEILAAGALTTVQDRGRQGSLRWGVGTAGAMDGLALAAGNLLLGNDPDCAAVEIQVFPFRARFCADGCFALTGADALAELDGLPLMPWSVHSARAGQELRLGAPRAGALRTSRTYIGLPGGIDVPRVLNSRSTQLRGSFGGLAGRALEKGDRLQAAAPAGTARAAGLGLVPPQIGLPLQIDGCTAVRVIPAAEYEQYTEAAHQALWGNPWKITPHSDRYGYRLAGEQPLRLRAPLEMRSHGIVPGVIQVPPDGQPIVQMRDAQPTGGYPKIGTVIDADLWRLGQAPIGSRIRFVETSWDAALAALDEVTQWLAEAGRQISLYAGLRGNA